MSEARKFKPKQWVTHIPTGRIGEVLSVSDSPMSYYSVKVRLVGKEAFNYPPKELEPLKGILPFIDEGEAGDGTDA